MLDILVPVVTLRGDELSLRAATDFAAKFGARVVVLIIAVGSGSRFAEPVAPLSQVLLDIAAPDQSPAALERKAIVDWLAQTRGSYEIRDCGAEAALVGDEVVAHARLADFTLITRAPGERLARRELFTDVLFKSGRPVLLMPSERRTERTWERVLVAWDAKPEAVRAVVAAMPLLQAASQVRLVTVDAVPSRSGHGQAPGRDVAAYLSRRGVRVEVSNIDGLGRTTGRALQEAAMDFGADLIVMGAYGHAQVREALFGGVTRELTVKSKAPLFMAH